MCDKGTVVGDHCTESQLRVGSLNRSCDYHMTNTLCNTIIITITILENNTQL